MEFSSDSNAVTSSSSQTDSLPSSPIASHQTKVLPIAIGFNCCQLLPNKYACFRSRQKSRHLSETAFDRPSERELLSTRRTYTPATVTSMIRPVNISVTNSLPVFESSAMLVGVIRQLAITTGGPPGEVNSCNLPGDCAN